MLFLTANDETKKTVPLFLGRLLFLTANDETKKTVPLFQR